MCAGDALSALTLQVCLMSTIPSKHACPGTGRKGLSCYDVGNTWFTLKPYSPMYFAPWCELCLNCHVT